MIEGDKFFYWLKIFVNVNYLFFYKFGFELMDKEMFYKFI